LTCPWFSEPSLNANRKTPIYQSVSFRFRRPIKLARGLKVNLSQNGTPVSVVGHGLTENFSRRGIRQTLGLPGSGQSHSRRIAQRSHRRRSHIIDRVASSLFLAAMIIWACGSMAGGLLLILAGLILAFV
jgi:hypothetical protein